MAHDPSADDGDTLLPDLLPDRYRVEGRLGEGGLGIVVKAFDTRLKRTVAIKTLKRSLAATDLGHYRALEDRFSREAEAGSRVGDHPNLVTVYDLVMDAERTQYLICQYVPGGTLADRIAQGPLPLADALRLTADVARGLQAAHDAGIVHRDIKPSNIFLATDGHAQVGDFGIAQMDHLSNRTHALMSHPGTPLYMSPEQAQTTGYVRPDTDQYSLGLVLFEMLTGKAYKRLRDRQAEALLAEQPSAVAALIRQMTAPRPDDRYDDMGDIIVVIAGIQRQPDSTAVAPITEGASESPAQPGRVQDTPRLGDVMVRDSPSPAPLTVRDEPPVIAPLLAPRSTKTLDGGWALPMLPDTPSRSKMSVSRRAVLFGVGGLAIATSDRAVAHYAVTSAFTSMPSTTGRR